MSATRSMITFLLIALLLQGGGRLDLCACDESVHGVFCSDEVPVRPTSCCSPPDQKPDEECPCCPAWDLEQVQLWQGVSDDASPPVVVDGTTVVSSTADLGRGSLVALLPRSHPPPLRTHLLLNVLLC